MPFGWVAAGTAILGAVSSNHAANAQEDAANNATAAQKAMFDTTQANVAPWMDAGKTALGTLSRGVQDGTFNPTQYGQGTQLGPYTAFAPQNTIGNTPYVRGVDVPADMTRVGMAPSLSNYGAQSDLKAYKDYTDQNPFVGRGDFTADKFHQDPGYQFQLQQGLDALTNKASMAGGINSNNLKGLVGYAEGMANTDYQQAFGNYQTEANRAQSEYNTGLQSYIQQFMTGQNTNTLNNNVTQQNNQNRIQTTGLNNQVIGTNLDNQIRATGFNNEAAQQDFKNQVTANQISSADQIENWKNSVAGLAFNNNVEQQRYNDVNTSMTLNNQTIGANNADALQRQQLNNQNLQQQYSNLATLSEAGRGAALNQAQVGTQVGQSIGNNIIGAGNANAAGKIGVANSLTGGLSQGYNAWLQNQYMNPYSNMGISGNNASGFTYDKPWEVGPQQGR